ncbi:asparagine synthetase B family protein [Ferrovibrio sp.]|uniref:asparagine synthetase B family protein n=1 Tax=Ferrovibrio sp. TaxID=1917215 RepID=UPI003D10F31F
MRLIGGFLHLDGRPAEAARLAAMATAMTAPGLRPRITSHVDGPVALLTIDFGQVREGTSLSPCEDSLALAADIRLDAPDQARDATGLAQLLAEQEIAGLEQLAGDFAFAAWNRQDRTLLCARDGFGIRPFFFAHRPDDLFVFASLPRGLHATGLVTRSIDPDFLVSELLFQFAGPERSLFKGVERLAPGGWLLLGPGRPARSGRHWAPDPAQTGSRRIGPVDAATELSRLVEQAVRRRLPAEGPVATHLSGGIDSSAIAILAARNLRSAKRELLAYSHMPTAFGPYSFGGDGAYLAPVLQQEPDIAWQPVRIDAPAAFVLPAMDADQLFPIDPSDRENRIFADAAGRGAAMLLSGWGGDEAASYRQQGVLVEALLSGHWLYLASELRSAGSVRAAWGELSPFLMPDAVRAFVHRLTGRTSSPPGVADLAAGLLRAKHLAGRYPLPSAMPADARRRRLSMLGGHGLTRRVEQWALLSARYGMSAGFPLLDRQLVEFALSLPSELFLREGWSRRVFRDAMAGVLPEDIRWKRTKLDLVVEDPVYVAAQRPLLAERLAAMRHREAIAGLFDLDAVAARLAALPPAEILARTIDTGQGDWAGIENAGSLMRAFKVMAYLEQHG